MPVAPHIINIINDVVAANDTDTDADTTLARIMGKNYLISIADSIICLETEGRTILDTHTRKEIAAAKAFFECTQTPNLPIPTKTELAQIWGRFTTRYGDTVQHIKPKEPCDTCLTRIAMIFEKI